MDDSHIIPSTLSTSATSPPQPAHSGGFVIESGDGNKRRRGRQATACRDCNRRKQKCDGTQPCANCVKRRVGSQCVFPTTHDVLATTPESSLMDPLIKRRKVDSTISSELYDDNDDEEDSAYRNRGGIFPPSSSRSAGMISGMEEHYSIRARYSPPPPPSHPISSERGQLVTTTDRGRGGESATDEPQYWKRDRSGERSGANSAGDGHSSRGWSETEPLLDDEGGGGVGRLYEDHPEEIDSERTFFGTSHFGPQLAARVIRGTPSVPLSDMTRGRKRSQNFSSDTKPYTLVSQIRTLIQLLPRRSVCDHFASQYFARYNDHIDILYRDDFYAKYDKFWERSFDLEAISSIDLRWLSLLLIVLAFGILLDRDVSRDRQENLQDREEMSLSWFWGARRALVEAPSFYGESLDTVRASALVALYLIVCRRVPEAWTTIGNAIRSAQAQGLHIDGEKWRLPLKESEIRRRLWAQLYIIDRSISLFLGRPLAIQDDQCAVRAPVNLTDEDLSSSVNPLPIRPLSHPTKSTFLILHQKLAHVIGKFIVSCFGLKPRTYAVVLEAEQLLQTWRRDLPPHFKLEDPDTSLDIQCPWLKPQRHTLCSKFHLARIALHRPYLLKSFGGKSASEYRASAEACVTSAIADITLRLGLNESDPLDRFKWMTVASGFSPATVIGILCARRHRDPRIDYVHLLSLLEGYIAVEKTTSRTDESLEAELRVLDLMVDQAKSIDEENRQKLVRRPNGNGNGIVNGNGNSNGNGISSATNGHTINTVKNMTLPTYPTQPGNAVFPLQHYNHLNTLAFLNPSPTPSIFTTNPTPTVATTTHNFTGYTDTGEEWMLPFGAGGQAWVPAPDWDTTASGLPDPGDGKGWQEVMEYVMSGMSASPNELLAV